MAGRDTRRPSLECIRRLSAEGMDLRVRRHSLFRKQDAVVTYEECIPVQMRRRQGLLTVRITSVDDAQPPSRGLLHPHYPNPLLVRLLFV